MNLRREGGQLSPDYPFAETEVSIPVWCDWWNVVAAWLITSVVRFNSSVVRLVAVYVNVSTSVCNEFQFQCGAIGGRNVACEVNYHLRFNSSVVRLVAILKYQGPNIPKGFNSSVVRLVARNATRYASESNCFNSSVVRLVAAR